MLRKHSKNHLNTHPRYYFALGLMSAFVVLLASILFLTANQIGTNQDVRRSASEANGSVEVTIGGGSVKVGEQLTLPFTVKNFAGVTGVEIVFSVTGPAGMIGTVDVDAGTSGLTTQLKSIADVTNGKRVRFVATADNINQGLSLADGTAILTVKLTPAQAGSLTITVDNTNSFITTIASNDQLRSIANKSLEIASADSSSDSEEDSSDSDTSDSGSSNGSTSDTNQDTSTETATAKDDLYLKDYSYKLFNGSTEISGSQLQSGQTYKVQVTATAQNNVKDEKSTNNTSVVMKLKVVDSGYATYTFAYSDLQKQVGGITRTLETQFVARSEVKIQTIIDDTNAIAESNEGNNMVETVITNSTSTSGVGGTKSFASYCNAYCADNTECGYGLTCWNNQCRNATNVSSTTCAGANSTVAGCGISCESNADCAPGLVCSSKVCRNPANVSSVTCSSQTASATKSTTTTSATATPKPTTKPTGDFAASASATAAATPIALITPAPSAQPTATPTTMGDEVFLWLAGLGIINVNDPQSINTVGMVLIAGGGALLLLFLFVAFLRSRRHQTQLTPPPAAQPHQPSFTPFPAAPKSTIAIKTSVPPPSAAHTTTFQPVPYGNGQGAHQSTPPQHQPSSPQPGVFPSAPNSSPYVTSQAASSAMPPTSVTQSVMPTSGTQHASQSLTPPESQAPSPTSGSLTENTSSAGVPSSSQPSPLHQPTAQPPVAAVATTPGATHIADGTNSAASSSGQIYSSGSSSMMQRLQQRGISVQPSPDPSKPIKPIQ